MIFGVFLALVAVHPALVSGQEVPPAADSVPASAGVSPKGAFIRALVLPGWGHASIDSYTRGGFYFVAETASAWTLFRTRQRLQSARARADSREALLRAAMAARGLDEAEVRTALEGDGLLQELDALVAAREEQQEDWVALGIFLLLLSGADAYVSAHLAHFPEPIVINAGPTADGRIEVSAGIRLPLR
ncbi:MAG: hypothetical protein OEZ37_11775 [Gemmatimonadota bacterium]|nr:hypothetical protein [Gemmatimonadota bacterium]